MSQINSNIKDDFQVVLLLSCFVGHPVCTDFSSVTVDYEFVSSRFVTFKQCNVLTFEKVKSSNLKFYGQR